MASNPKLIAYTIGVGVLALVSALIPVVGFLAALILLGGVYGLAHAAVVKDSTTFEDYTRTVKERWKSLTGAYVAIVGGAIVGAFIFYTALFFVIGFGSIASAGGTEQSSGAGFAALGFTTFLFLFLGLVAIFIIQMVVQFVPVSICVGGENMGSSFGKSWELVRRDPLSVTGFTLLRGIVGFVGFLVVFLIAGVVTGASDTAGATTAFIGLLLFYPLFGTFLVTYRTVYFLNREETDAVPMGSTGAQQKQAGRQAAGGVRQGDSGF